MWLDDATADDNDDGDHPLADESIPFTLLCFYSWCFLK